MQDVIALFFVALAGGYILKCAIAVCRAQKAGKSNTHCGNCSDCSSNRPTVVELQLIKNNRGPQWS